MSWDQIWKLPRSPYSREEVDRAVKKAVEEYGDVKRPQPDPDLEEFAEDFAADEEEEERFEYGVLIPPRLLEEAGDEPEEEPGDDGLYECVFSVYSSAGGPGEADHWQVHVYSNEAQNRDANLAVSTIAARVSVLLGGSEDPEPI